MKSLNVLALAVLAMAFMFASSEKVMASDCPVGVQSNQSVQTVQTLVRARQNRVLLVDQPPVVIQQTPVLGGGLFQLNIGGGRRFGVNRFNGLRFNGNRIGGRGVGRRR
jgi:hypothetical protein